MDVLNVDMQKKCSYERVFFFSVCNLNLSILGSSPLTHENK